ncbi:MAG TPA: flagellar filament capping protein FliD [Candidatus Binatia bacterium]|nr:flagellar filament capping protein FliD [Candidatus Binatia bacterium]
MGISLNPSTILSGQGLDVSALVQQIINSQSGELTVWQSESTTLATQNGVLDGIENDLTNLQTAVQALNDPAGALTSIAATSSNPAVLTASSQATVSTVASGNYEVAVSSLASAGAVFSAPVAAGANGSFLPANTVSGNLQLQIGSGASASTYNIAITPGVNDTLSSLAAYITAQSAANNWGVTANVVTDATGSWLDLQSQNTGSAGALAITSNTVAQSTLSTADLATADSSVLAGSQQSADLQLQIGNTTQDIQINQNNANTTLSGLAGYINNQNLGVTASVVQDPSGKGYYLQLASTANPAQAVSFANNTTALTPVVNSTGLSFTSAGGTNANITVNGVPYASATNTINPPSIPGVTLSLTGTSSSPVEVSVGPDVNQITSAINNFVSAYNTVVSAINAQYQVDPTGATPAPPLESDTSLRSLQSSILADAAYAIGGNSGYVNLASLGINMNNDGTLTVGSNASGQSFAEIVAANPSAVLNFFQSPDNTGFANNFNTDLTNLTDAVTGPLNADVTQNTATEQALSANILNFQTQMSNEQTQLTQQFDAVNASLESYPLLLQEVTQTLGTLGSGTSSSGALIPSGPTLTSGL